jgi:peptidoglycan hydrolase-like protein with peptidoglycan-binding domain
MQYGSKMDPRRPAHPVGRLMRVAVLLAGGAVAPACGSGHDGVGEAGAPPAGAAERVPAESALKRGDRGPEVLELYQYLKAYGYFPNAELHKYSGWKPALSEEPADPQVFDAVLERALVLFQRTHGLPQDGLLNERTRQLMRKPRCGLPDSVRTGEEAMASFTTFGSPWPKRNSIQYAYGSFTPDMPASTARTAMNQAFARWMAVAGLRLIEGTVAQSDIVINFYSGDHGDGASNAFDGPNGVLAHAFTPPLPGLGGDVHFDEAETWSNDGSGTDLFTVALHEFGHALGLGHSTVTNAVMYAYYSGMRRELTADDIQGIRSLYPNNVLLTDKGLLAGQSVTSKDGRFSLTMQGDGNLVHYWHGHGWLWSTGTFGTQGKSAWMQADGNFVLYTTLTPTFGYHLWSTNTYEWDGLDAYLIVQDDGDVVIRIFGENGPVVWSTGTGGH